MAKDVSLPSTPDVVAVSGGHPGNPWREQRLLFLYQSEPEANAAAATAAAAEALTQAA